jgi:uncharacterized pyridoxamine 5'-phosphate oxidase family protein
MNEYLKELVEKMHTVVLATVDKENHPQTRAIEIMLNQDDKLYFLTATTKPLYEELIINPFISFTGIKGQDVMSSKAITVSGIVRGVGQQLLKEILIKNPYMEELYPTPEKKETLRVFEMAHGRGQFFDLSVVPPVSVKFEF